MFESAHVAAIEMFLMLSFLQNLIITSYRDVPRMPGNNKVKLGEDKGGRRPHSLLLYVSLGLQATPYYQTLIPQKHCSASKSEIITPLHVCSH